MKQFTAQELQIMADEYGNLDLRGCTGITSLPDNLTVGGDLDLYGCTGITSLPDNLTVGGWLNLRGCTGITSLPDNLTVGGGLYLYGTGITHAERKKVRYLRNGDVVPGRYIYADNMLFHYTGRSKRVGEFTVYVGKIKNQYLVSDGTYWAHCRTPRDGIADIQFKRVKDRGADQYRGIDIDAEYTVPELQTMYRVITGACRAGTEAFTNGVKDLKERYTIREAIELTRGQYNSEAFEEFMLSNL